ncbi:helix-turn-helix domain-containing protein, partial [Streptomyces sp. NPDC059092]|uniref:helix-turn-helix domain-containing protein n=1 Tax=Streptomyces sp. NPDC059092 TaxID=3346725 RepID=UPI0036BAB423
MTDEQGAKFDRGPQNHRTIDRVTRIIEEVVYSPGLTFADLHRSLDAPPSSVHGFIRGLLAAGWIHQDGNRFHAGPALYGLTLASGSFRAGQVTDADITAIHQASG